jgi:shikimate kinase
VKTGKAIAYGAATIVNAIATGYGAALGVDLWTQAAVKLTEKPGIITGRIKSDPHESKALIKTAVTRVLRKFRLDKKYGAIVETDSDIPIARGMKSSSTTANAIVLATLSALGKKLPDLSIVNLGVDAAMDAKVTITGAFDDACASYFGGAVITNNMQRKIMKRLQVKEKAIVLFHVPKGKVYTSNLEVENVKIIAPIVMAAHKEALHGHLWNAMTLNGIMYSVALGYDTKIAQVALKNGALAAGLTGKGPAVAAVVPEGKIDSVKKAWQAYEGEILEAKINRKKAHTLR